ncbi:MAG: hypothetical protein COW13_01225 [Candidatus Omnitrophica bacterium CG12_big_fil_rev_8_21_14_0_65_50_5]|nr:MAG: hypothetical protein COW13_01225 [Candidatus Omnitrophica bacterium CG12_big_fil_rev_8_21_14_0_65_50_5]
MKQNKSLVTVLVIFAAIAVVAGIKIVTQGQLTQSSGTSRTKGNSGAPVKIVEYIDFQCPMCAVGARTIKDYMDRYPDKIFLDMRYFPLDMHRHALVASQYAECAGRQDKFWTMHDVILEKQKSWAETVNASTVFDIYAKESGLNMGKLKACLSDDNTAGVIQRSRKEGMDIGIRSTPTYFINGKMVVGIKLLQEELDHLLGVTPKTDSNNVQ